MATPFFNKTKDVLQHHNRIIDHNSDHERQGQHRDLIQRESHRTHQPEGCDQRRESQFLR
jgi:hypothetical protein